MFYRDSHHVYRVRPLERFSWLEHGFGTRHSPDFALDGNLATLRQIHSNMCMRAGGKTGVLGEGDALLENIPGRRVGVKTADCVPILLVDEEHRAVAAVHAGWRGTVQGIAGEAVRRMAEEFATRPERLHAALGPAIGNCCYQVGAEVAAQFGQPAACHIDLLQANSRQLLAAGVPQSQLYAAGLCTMCGGEEFHSYRRDQQRAGRMLSVVGVR